jgi:glycosyltransferase involved in cell wall biosynthesis
MAQTAHLTEIICIDNNSSDRTWELLQEIKKTYPDLIIARELQRGANFARNKGLSLAKGEWIQFLDADDLLEPDKISHQVNAVAGCSEDIAFLAASSRKIKLNGEVEIKSEINQNKYLAVFSGQCGNTCSNLWRRDWLLKIGGWNENLASSQESDLMLRLILAGGNYLVDKVPKTIIRDRASGQISQSNPTDRWKRYIDVHAEFCNHLKIINSTKYNEHRNFYRESLLISIITLATYNLNEGEIYYHRYIRGYKITDNIFSAFFIKMLLIRICGFKGFMKVKLAWNRINT